jgi:hypothetical protein
MSIAKFEKGLALRKQVLGAEYVEKSLAGADELQPADAGALHGVLLGATCGRGQAFSSANAA